MNIVITGAAGFVGKSLTKLLVEQGHNLYCVYRSSELQSDHYNTIVADLETPDFSSVFPSKIDCVVHLAQSSMYRDFPSGVKDMQSVNVNAMVQLLEWARTVEVKHFIFTSTANVYSPSDQLLEEDSPTVPESFYGATKLAAENFARQYQPYFQVDILRLFTVFGPGQRSMLIPTMIERIKNGKEIILAEDVGISLTPIYIADLLNVINQFIQLPAIGRSRTVNVCGSSVVSLKKIVGTLEKLIGIPAKTRITESKATSMKGSCAALERIIGSFCITDLNNGLQSTISNRTEESV